MLNFDQITALCEMATAQNADVGVAFQFVKCGNLSATGKYDFRSWHIVSNVEYDGKRMQMITGSGSDVGITCKGLTVERVLTVADFVKFVELVRATAVERRETIGRNWHLTQYPG